MEHKLWTPTVTLAQLKSPSYFFLGEMGPWKVRNFNSMQIKMTHFPMGVSGNHFSWDIARILLPLATGLGVRARGMEG